MKVVPINPKLLVKLSQAASESSPEKFRELLGNGSDHLRVKVEGLTNFLNEIQPMPAQASAV